MERTAEQIHRDLLAGTVSSGTYRRQDLIPAFLDALAIAYPAAYAQITVNGDGIPAYVADEGDSSEWWESEDADNLLDELFEQLYAAAPEGMYFGAHPGDGADFGFWEVSDESL